MKDVRQSIHDAIYQINANANEALDLAQIKFGTAVTSPTSPVGSYVEGTVYFNVATGIIWKLSGGSWSQLGTMKTIDTIAKTATVGLTDTYTITYCDGSTSTYDVTNGVPGVSITNITKGATTGNTTHYDVNLSDGTTTATGFDVSDGVSISNITLASTVGNVKNYDINLSDGTTTPTGFSVADGTSSYVYIRYSSQFDGTGMVTVPTSSTVYIGICVTNQSTAPTSPSVYSWVRFIGSNGTGTGDMLKADYSTKYANVVDKAAALYDGANEILANELLDKTTYCAKGVAGTVDKATELVDVTNAKTADTVLLANLTDVSGVLNYKGNAVGVEYINDVTTDFTVTSKKLALASGITAKLPTSAPSTTKVGQAPVIQSDGSVDWATVKGGHDMLSTVASVEAITSSSDTHVVSAYAIKGYSNRYTIGLETTITASNNTVTITDNALKDDNATYEFFFEPTLNASSEYEYLTLAKYELDTTIGEITITVVDAPTVNTKIRVDITTYRTEV